MDHFLDKLIARCEAIAKANRDEFSYIIKLDVNKRNGSYKYNVVVAETSDGHTFVSGTSVVLDEAVQEALDAITDECETWGYKEPKTKET